LNQSVALWCAGRPDLRVETRRLVEVLDVLAAHYSAEIDEDLVRGRTLAA